MQRLGRQRGEDAAFSKGRVLQGFVVGQHRPRHVAPACFGDGVGDARAELRERLGLFPRPVVEDEFVPCPNEIFGDARAHASNSDEADFHRHVSPSAACLGSIGGR